METRLVIAYTLLALLAMGGAWAVWLWLTRLPRRLKRDQRMRERWLRLPPVTDRP